MEDIYFDSLRVEGFAWHESNAQRLKGTSLMTFTNIILEC